MKTNQEQDELSILKKAFESFNLKTEHLANAYQELEGRIADLDRELEIKNAELNDKVVQLNTATNYVNSVLESMNSGLVGVDFSGAITTYNAAMQRFTGLSFEQVKGCNYVDVFLKNHALIDMLKEVMDLRETIPNRECVIVDEDNNKRVVDVSITFIHDKQGPSEKGVLMVLRDLTEIKSLQEELKRTERLKVLGQMSATVAHEIRNPLGGIEGFASLLERDLRGDDDKHRLVVNILDGSRSLNHIVTSLLDFTKPLQLDFKKLNPESVIDATLLFLGCRQDEQGIYYEKDDAVFRLEKRCAENVTKIAGDEGKLRQVFMNIVINSFQALEKSGKVMIEITQESCDNFMGDAIVFRIKDNGSGIDENVLPNLFNPFFTTKEKGTGLGLAIVQKIVEAHNGFIEVKIENGTVFELYFPAVKQ